MSYNGLIVGVVIPCYKVQGKIGGVVSTIPDFVDKIWLVDDACPVKSWKEIEAVQDRRVVVLHNLVNQGVGGAMVTGFREALESGVDIVIKIDGDGQMNPSLCLDLIQPIVKKEADFVKGCRFLSLQSLAQMPKVRLFGNSVLSFVNKIVSGYWDTMDPTNGFLAIHRAALSRLELEKLSRRYFFESDLLFRLGLTRSVVVDFPMEAVYADEVSNLSISNVIRTFPSKYLKRFFKRLFYMYLLRDFNFGSVALIFGTLFLSIGSIWGAGGWIYYSRVLGVAAPTGTIVIPAMLIILGFQLLISFIQYDIQSTPNKPLCRK